MGKLREIWNGEHKGFVRYATVVTLAFLLYVGFISPDSILRWVKSGIQLHQQEQQIEMYREQIKEMDDQVRLLSTDRDSLEDFAREHFRLAAPGEDVYLDPED
jgi:cell division protein FtsB